MPLRRRTNNGAWLIDFRVDGRRIRETYSASLAKDEVEAIERKRRREVEDELYYASSKSKVKGCTFIYFLRSAEGLIKIGVTTDFPKRLAAIQNAHGAPLEVLATVRGDREIEQLLHVLFTPYRAVGEWFRLPAELLSSCQRLGSGTAQHRRSPAGASTRGE